MATSLSLRLFLATILAVLFVETLLFIPSAGNFRTHWLNERVSASRIASLALEAAPMREVSRELSDELLVHAEILGLAELEDGMRIRLLPARLEHDLPMRMIDLRKETSRMSNWRALRLLSRQEDHTLLVRAEGVSPDRTLEILLPEAVLREHFIAYFIRILLMSLLVAVSAGSLIYLLLHIMVVRPMRRVTRSVEGFALDPRSWKKQIKPTRRRDEIGRAQNALADMEATVRVSLHERDRLAELGIAVAKINHDLRNSLAAAQLVSDGLALVKDPRVERAAPRLERALQRALTLTSRTLEYGKSGPQIPQMGDVNLAVSLDEAAEEALAAAPNVQWSRTIPPNTLCELDPEFLHRIAVNLIRNAAQAMPDGGAISCQIIEGALHFRDTGPGLPPLARKNLFKPFASSTKQDGSGLGLSIARELARAMGGDISLVSSDENGTCFAIQLANPLPTPD